MTRFNTPEEVIAFSDEVAADDYRRHIEFNIALNPFCTEGARNQWQRGFDNAGPRTYETTIDYDTIYQRGRAVARLLEAKKNE